MASEEGVTAAAAASAAAIAEEVAARTRDLVRRVLRFRPGGSLDVEVAANQAAEGARLYVVTIAHRLHPVRREDIEAVAIGSAAGFLSVIARSNGLLNLPDDLVEAVIGNADAADQAANNSAPIYFVLAFSIAVILTELICLWCR